MNSRDIVLFIGLLVFYNSEIIFATKCSSCILLRQCDDAMNAMKKVDSQIIDKFVKSRCGYQIVNGQLLPKICCSEFAAIDNRFNYNDTEVNIENHINFQLLPKTCGNINGNRIIGGEVAKLYEFPWMALISYTIGEFQGKKKHAFKCDGSIIHPRYILTAAHCVKDKEIAGVRVGEYNINTKEDCQGEGSFRFCESYIQNVGVAEIIVHENYSTLPQPQNDIALLRLKKSLDITRKNIQPICLPIYNELINKNIDGRKATVAGWGVTELDLAPETLLKVEIGIKTYSECKQYYEKTYTRSLNLMDKKFCAGDEGKDSCRGDSGGPLMMEDKYNGTFRVIQYGVVSYGPQKCGSSIPGVYTDLRKYIKWILDNIKE